MAERILVSFQGEDSGTAELTWGQQHIWEWMQESGLPLSMSATRPLAEGATVEEFMDELRFFMNRFQAMRTRLRFDESGRPAQIVAGAGEVPLEIVEADDGADPAVVADGIAAVHKGSPFDYEREWPVRMALVRQNGHLTHLVTTLCHVVVDSAAAMVMFTDLLARDPITGAAAGPVAGAGPLQLAHWQRSPAGQRQSAGSLRYWEQQLRSIPAAPPPRTVAEPDRFWQLDFESPAMHLALRRVIERLASGTAPVLLAAFAVALTRATGRNPAGLQVIVSNRFRPGLAEVVSPVNLPGLCVIDADDDFDEVVVRAKRQAINAYKYAYYDVEQRHRLVERISQEREVPIDLAAIVNDRRTQLTFDPNSPLPTVQEVRAALSRTAVHRQRLDFYNKQLVFTINDAPEAVAFTLEADARYLPVDEVEDLARSIEEILVAAA